MINIIIIIIIIIMIFINVTCYSEKKNQPGIAQPMVGLQYTYGVLDMQEALMN